MLSNCEYTKNVIVHFKKKNTGMYKSNNPDHKHTREGL